LFIPAFKPVSILFKAVVTFCLFIKSISVTIFRVDGKRKTVVTALLQANRRNP
jgi:hypothetical protein